MFFSCFLLLSLVQTVYLCCQLAGALGRGKKVYIVCCEPGARAALGTVAGADVRDLNAKNLPPVKAGDVQVVVTPVGFLIVYKNAKAGALSS